MSQGNRKSHTVNTNCIFQIAFDQAGMETNDNRAKSAFSYRQTDKLAQI